MSRRRRDAAWAVFFGAMAILIGAGELIKPYEHVAARLGIWLLVAFQAFNAVLYGISAIFEDRP